MLVRHQNNPEGVKLRYLYVRTCSPTAAICTNLRVPERPVGLPHLAPTFPPFRVAQNVCFIAHASESTRPLLNWKIAARVCNLLGTARRQVAHGDAAAINNQLRPNDRHV